VPAKANIPAMMANDVIFMGFLDVWIIHDPMGKPDIPG
jgi:hypothetical protein